MSFQNASAVGELDLSFPAGGPDDSARRRSALAIQRTTALGEMTAGIAHDFRNVLAVIGSALNLARRERPDSARLEQSLDAARDGIERGVSLVDKLLLFAKPRPQSFRPEDVNGLLETLKVFLDYAAGPGISVRLELQPGLPPCRLDASRFCTAILNLVLNARDAMKERGTVRIVTSLLPLLESARHEDDDHCVMVRVIDQGCGMGEAVRARIFEPYFTTKGEVGTGLGIPQVAAFVRESGGCLNVSSEPGAGTSFDLFFPIAGGKPLIGTSLWRQLDRWTNEGGATPGEA